MSLGKRVLRLEAIHLHARSIITGESWGSQVTLASPMTSSVLCEQTASPIFERVSLNEI